MQASILSNITTLKLRRNVKATVDGTASGYDVVFGNALYNPHSGHNSSSGGIVESTSFKVSGDNNDYQFDDDGNGNIRRYSLIDSVRVYKDNNAGTINYSTGKITINSLEALSLAYLKTINRND